MRRWALNHLAAWCVLFGMREKAIELYERMLELDANDALALASIGYQRAQLGDKRAAMAAFDRLLAAHPNNVEGHFNRGFLFQERNDHERAVEALSKAVELAPDHDRALYGLALSLISLRRLDEAIPLLKRNTRLQPMSPYGWYQLARVHHELGHDDDAQKVLDHLRSFEPKVARQLARETGLHYPE